MVEVAPHFEFLSLQMKLFIDPTLCLIFSIYAFYDNVRSIARKDTPGGCSHPQWVRFISFQLMRFRRWKRLTCVFIGFARSGFVILALLRQSNFITLGNHSARSVSYQNVQVKLIISLHDSVEIGYIWSCAKHRQIWRRPRCVTSHVLNCGRENFASEAFWFSK